MTIPQALALAFQRHQAGRLAEAEALYRQILAAQPRHAEALHHLGVIANQVGRHELAVDLIRQAIDISPNNPAACSNLGIALRKLGRLDDAAAACRHAINLKPDYLEAHINLANVLRQEGQFDEAIGVSRRAIELKPDYAEAHSNLGAALALLGHLDEAIATYRYALELMPGYSQALNNLGNALKDQGELDEALAAFRHALRTIPRDASIHGNVIYTLHYHPGHDGAAIAEEHRRWNRQFSDPLKPFLLPHGNDRSPNRRLRVGYVSTDFRDHTVARFVLPLFERHDHERFEILCYSGVLRPDWMTERLRALAAGWRSTLGVPDSRMAEMIREDGVDILVDLAMHTADNRLQVFARQPAPVQVSWLAYAGSTGLDRMTHRLTDAQIDPPGEQPASSSEEPVRLPDCWCCYSPAPDAPEVHELPALSSKWVTFGALNNFAKVHEGVLALWARALAAVAESRLLMFCPEGRTRERVWAFFAAHQIGADRVELVRFLPIREHLSLYHRIDIALDTFPYNGVATTCDALWMGAPVVTLPGARAASRAGLSLLSSIGLAELAASSEDDYARIAAELAADLPRLAKMRATLRPRMQSSPLMDAPCFARNIEAAYRSMWERWRLGRSPICSRLQ